MRFIARRNDKLSGYILLAGESAGQSTHVDYQRFGLLVGTTFFCEDEAFEAMVNADLRPKMSRNCVLEHIKTRFMAYYLTGRSMAEYSHNSGAVH